MLKCCFNIFCYLFVFNIFFLSNMATAKVAAFLRVKDEIKTIEPCLNSIDGVFDKIVIIHSNEKDDGSIAFMNEWCSKRKECEIHEYPHAVVPSHDKRYKSKVPFENTLVAYNNFGLSFFEPEEWVVKIDADQVYIKERLKKAVRFVQDEGKENIKYFFVGYNTFPWNDYLVKFKARELNGTGGDSYFVKRKNIESFGHRRVYEHLRVKNIKSSYRLGGPVWFHFMKKLKSKGVMRETNSALESEVSFLSKEERDLFEKEIRPLLKNSPYYNLKLEKE